MEPHTNARAKFNFTENLFPHKTNSPMSYKVYGTVNCAIYRRQQQLTEV